MTTKIVNYTFEGGWMDDDDSHYYSTIGFCKETPLKVLRTLYHNHPIHKYNGLKLGCIDGLVITSTKPPAGTTINGRLELLNFSQVKRRDSKINNYEVLSWLFDNIPRYPPNPTFSDTLLEMTHREAFNNAKRKGLITNEMIDIVSIALKRTIDIKDLERLVNKEWADELSFHEMIGIELDRIHKIRKKS